MLGCSRAFSTKREHVLRLADVTDDLIEDVFQVRVAGEANVANLGHEALKISQIFLETYCIDKFYSGRRMALPNLFDLNFVQNLL